VCSHEPRAVKVKVLRTRNDTDILCISLHTFMSH